MRRRLSFILLVLVTALVAALPPWLAWREARRQAYDIEASLALNYARDILHRSDETFAQALDAIRRVSAAGWPPCSAGIVALMRKIDLESSYIQAVGHVRDGAMECSSIGGTSVPLGKPAYRTARGIDVYGKVVLDPDSRTALLGLARGDVVVLVHRDLPLDIWTAVPGVSLAFVRLQPYYVNTAHGHIDPHWAARLGADADATFVDGDWLVAVVRSQRYLSGATVAAVPLVYLQRRIDDATRRLLPVGLLVGLIAAVAVVLLARRQMSMASALRVALRRGEFFLLYQPLIDLRTNRCVGVEALLRWRRGDGELVGPELFIPIAEHSGLITRLTARVLDLIEADTGRYLASHPDFHVAINLSAADLMSPAVVERIDALLARTGARPTNLIVEITERSLLDMVAARPVIDQLRQRGIEVAIDDFGTGYSSLSYLETLDLDFLKIDRSFIEAIGTGAPTSQVVGHIIAMARTLDLRKIAEGVESEAQAEFLRINKVQFAQGWLYGKPMPFADVEHTLLRPQHTVAAPG